MSEDLRVQLVTPPIRMSYPVLLTPKKRKDDRGIEQGDPKYGLSMIIEAADLDKFKKEEDGKAVNVNVEALLKELAKKKWPDMELKDMFPKKPKGGRDWPLKKGDEMIEINAKLPKPKKLDHLEGKYQISTTASEKVPPQLSYRDEKTKQIVYLDRDNPEHVKKIKKLFEGGNYAVCEVSVVPQVVSEKCYITFYLNHVRFLRSGERLGGGGGMMDRLGGVDGGEGEYGNPSASDDDFGGDDEI